MKKWFALCLVCVVLALGTLTAYAAEEAEDIQTAVEEEVAGEDAALEEEAAGEDAALEEEAEEAIAISAVLMAISELNAYEDGFWAATSQYTLHYIVDEESIMTVNYDAEYGTLFVALQVTALNDERYNALYEQILAVTFPQKDAKTLIAQLKSYSWDTNERILAGHFEDEDQFVQLFYPWILL